MVTCLAILSKQDDLQQVSVYGASRPPAFRCRVLASPPFSVFHIYPAVPFLPNMLPLPDHVGAMIV
jgi:hypothetical protein